MWQLPPVGVPGRALHVSLSQKIPYICVSQLLAAIVNWFILPIFLFLRKNSSQTNRRSISDNALLRISPVVSHYVCFVSLRSFDLIKHSLFFLGSTSFWLYRVSNHTTVV